MPATPLVAAVAAARPDVLVQVADRLGHAGLVGLQHRPAGRWGAGVWQQLHHALLDELARDSQLDWSRASVDSLSVRAKRAAT